MVEGLNRAKLVSIVSEKPFFISKVEPVPPTKAAPNTPRTEALVRYSYSLFEKYISLAPKPTPEVLMNLVSSTDPDYISDYIAQNIFIRHTEKQAVLEELDSRKRLRMVNRILNGK